MLDPRSPTHRPHPDRSFTASITAGSTALMIALAACGSGGSVEPSSGAEATAVAIDDPAATIQAPTDSSLADAPSTSDVATTTAGPADALLTGEVVTIAGGTLDLASLRGTDVVLWFWAPW